MSDDTAKKAASETVVDETINAYRAQKLANGKVRIKSGGHVVVAPTYFEALERYARHEWGCVEDGPEHLRADKRASIADGWVPLHSTDSSGFTPEEILDAVVGQPLDRILDDLGDDQDGDGS